MDNTGDNTGDEPSGGIIFNWGDFTGRDDNIQDILCYLQNEDSNIVEPEDSGSEEDEYMIGTGSIF